MPEAIYVAGSEATSDILNQLGGLNSSTITYDADGNVETVTDDITGVVLTFAYDSGGQLETITDGTNTWTLTYDADGNVETIVRTP